VRDPDPVVIVGAGGHAKVVAELIAHNPQYRVIGLIDNVTLGTAFGLPILGADRDLPHLRQNGINKVFVAIGDNKRRLTLGREIQKDGFDIINAISSAATISPSAQIGVGVAIMSGAVLNADCRIEDFAVVNSGAIIDHDCIIGEGAHVAPGCALAGNVKLGRGAFLGTGTSVIPGISVGDGAIVGAGACLVRDLPANIIAMGVPARIVRAV
jgi:UDP-perosamine 4-acetyltransferase